MSVYPPTDEIYRLINEIYFVPLYSSFKEVRYDGIFEN